MKPLVIFHSNCTDGLTAAWVALRSLGDADTHAAQYGSEPPDVRGRDVYILDFSYQRDAMMEIARQAGSLTVLDHHRTAEAALAEFADECRMADRLVDVVLDMNRSGARLAWDWFRERENSPSGLWTLISHAEWLVNFVQDRDLWRWELPDSHLVSAAIEAYPRTFEAWDELARKSPVSLAGEGAVIQRYRERCIESACSLARVMQIGGQWVPAANCSEMRFASDIAHLLCRDYPFAATYWVRDDGIVQFSLRSREGGGADVSEIAKQYGGGGHLHAAGFQLKGCDFFVMLAESREVERG